MAGNTITNYPGLTAKEVSDLKALNCTEEQMAKMNQRKLDEIAESLKKYTLRMIDQPDSAWKGKELRLVLLGKTGAGKSTLGNMLIGGEKTFVESFHSRSCTKTIKEKSTTIDGITVKIIDTPGFDDTDRSVVEILAEIAKVVDAFSDGIHGFLFVHNAATHRFTNDQEKALDELTGLFGPSFLDSCYIVMSHGDAIAIKCSLEEYIIDEESSNFGKLVRKLKKRVILAETSLKDSSRHLQRQQIVRFVCSTNTSVYRNEDFRGHKRHVEKKVHNCVRGLVPIIEIELSKSLQDMTYEELSKLKGKSFDALAEKIFLKVKDLKEEGVPDKLLRQAVQELLYGKIQRLTSPTFLDKLKPFVKPLLAAAGVVVPVIMAVVFGVMR